MTHRHSDARSDGVELELAALRGRVAMVDAELVAVRATRDQLAAAVVCRKQWAATPPGTGERTWQVLASVLRTAAQQHRDPVTLVAGLLRARLAPPWPTSLSPPSAGPVNSTR